MPHFGFGISRLSGSGGGVGLIVAWNRFDIRPADVDEHPHGAALYATTQLVTTRQRIYVSSKSPIRIPEEGCSVNPDGTPADPDDVGTRGLVVVFYCLPQGSPGGSTSVVVLDFYEGSSLVYSAGARGRLKVELTAPASIDPDVVVIRERLTEQAFYDALEGLSVPPARAPVGRDLWVALMTSNHTASW